LDKSAFTVGTTHGIACTRKMGSVADKNTVLGWETGLAWCKSQRGVARSEEREDGRECGGEREEGEFKKLHIDID